jgi:hypothetical protein
MALDNEQRIKVWQQAIEAQMHFAELSIKMRQIGLTVAGATVALAVVLHRTGANYSLAIPCFNFLMPIGTILCFSAGVILLAAWTIDVGVYHKMLRGAVKFNELYERELDSDFNWKSGLTEAISAYSRYREPLLLDARNDDGVVWRSERGTSVAGNRITWFYLIIVGALALSGLMLLLVENNN